MSELIESFHPKIQNIASSLEYEFLENFTSIHTKKSYKNDITQFLEFLYAGHDASISPLEVQRVHIIAYKNWLSNLYAPKTICRKLSVLSKFYLFLMEKNLVETNPINGVSRPKASTINETNDLNDNDVIELFDYVKKNGSLLHQAIIFTFFTTGIRKSELINLKSNDFKFDGEHYLLKVRAKGGSSLKKLLPQETAQIIENYLYCFPVSHGNDWLFRPSKNPKNGNIDKPLTMSSIDYIVKKYTKMAGFSKNITAHSARATYIGSSLEAGHDIVKVSQDVGHKDIKTTLEYNKRRFRLKDSPVNSLGYLKKEAKN